MELHISLLLDGGVFLESLEPPELKELSSVANQWATYSMSPPPRHIKERNSLFLPPALHGAQTHEFLHGNKFIFCLKSADGSTVQMVGLESASSPEQEGGPAGRHPTWMKPHQTLPWTLIRITNTTETYNTSLHGGRESPRLCVP